MPHTFAGYEVSPCVYADWEEAVNERDQIESRNQNENRTVCFGFVRLD